MKFILLTILSTIIIFFVWNFLKRIFFNEFYRNQMPNNPQSQQNDKKRKVNWDAETVDYEEVKSKKTESQNNSEKY